MSLLVIGAIYAAIGLSIGFYIVANDRYNVDAKFLIRVVCVACIWPIFAFWFILITAMSGR